MIGYAVVGDRIERETHFVDCGICGQSGKFSPLFCPVCLSFIQVGERIVCKSCNGSDVSPFGMVERIKFSHYHEICFKEKLKDMGK